MWVIDLPPNAFDDLDLWPWPWSWPRYNIKYFMPSDLDFGLDMSKNALDDLWPWPCLWPWLDLHLSKMINGLRLQFWPRYATWPWSWPWPLTYDLDLDLDLDLGLSWLLCFRTLKFFLNAIIRLTILALLQCFSALNYAGNPCNISLFIFMVIVWI